MRSRRCCTACLVLVAAACSGSTPSAEPEPSPATRPPPPVEVSGPVEGGTGQATAAVQDLASRGYAESEYFFGGTATSYVGEHETDGVWDARADERADFRSRMIVRRPQDPARFSGTVVLEWLNTTIGSDTDPSWGSSAEEIIREGHAWVGVSAQEVGVQKLAETDPPRYGSLDHPGDRYSFDIFTHAGRALTNHDGAAPLGQMEAETLIAIGLSQSAVFLISYIDGVQPLTDTFDGFLVHAPAQPAPIRPDLDAPTLVFITESDLTTLGYQPDSDALRIWEVAGTSHADAWLLNQAGGGYAASNPAHLGGVLFVDCPGLLNEGPHRYVLRAALHNLVAWVTTGEAPPVAARIEMATEPGDGQAPQIARDEHGNARGGVRTPHVDVPVSALSGEPAPDSLPMCRAFGTTKPFDAATLAQLYPDHDSYVAAVTASSEAAVDAGFILRPDADEMIASAAKSAIGAA